MSGHGAQDDRCCGVRQNRVVLASVADVKLPVASLIRPDRSCHQAGSDGGKRNSSPGRARHKPSNHCAGDAGVLRLYLYARVRISLHLAHGTAGAASTRHSLLPLFGGQRHENLGRKVPRECETASSRHCERSATTTVIPREAGYPVRCGVSIPSLTSLAYWIVRLRGR